mmetsp:Transcript_20891/g.46408  ORF Transcript_20891/g.46408 Transcript_20891/m.46408 type:complete len:218 (+) Transcript_20891:628-1281(+)
MMNLVLTRYRRCQAPSYAATDANANTDTTMTDTNKTQTDAWNNNPWSTVATSLSQLAPTIVSGDTPMTDTTSKANNPDSDNTIDTTSDSTTMYATLTWALIKIGWNSNIPTNDSIHNPTPTPNPVDDSKTSQHPFIAKLSSFISSASKTHDSPIAIKTSRSKCILQPKDLHPYWSVNDFKNHFAYTTTNRRVQFTLWISMPSSLTLWTLKQPILGHL